MECVLGYPLKLLGLEVAEGGLVWLTKSDFFAVEYSDFLDRPSPPKHNLSMLRSHLPLLYRLGIHIQTYISSLLFFFLIADAGNFFLIQRVHFYIKVQWFILCVLFSSDREG